MTWHDIVDPGSRQLDQLAETYSLHSLHVEDCRQSAHRIKVESDAQYLFIVLKLLDLEQTNKLAVEDLILFVGSDFLITVHRSPIGLLDALRDLGEKLRTDQVLYRLANVVVDSYLPLIDKLEDIIERLHDQVVSAPRPNVLERIREIRSVCGVSLATRVTLRSNCDTYPPLLSIKICPPSSAMSMTISRSTLTRLQRSGIDWQAHWRFTCQASPTAQPRLHAPLRQNTERAEQT